MTETGGAGEVTEWLDRWAEGDSAALERLTPLVYNQLRAIADGLLQNERSGHTLQATALVNETFRKLLDLHRVALNDRVHFYTFAARLMRRILIDHARRWRAEKRGMRLDRVPLNDELAWVDRRAEESLDLSTALEELESLDAQKAKVVELRYFLGCTVPEIAALLNVSPSTIDRALRFSLAWLHDRLHGDLTDYGLRFRRTKYGSFIRSRASAIAGLIRSGADPSGGSAMPELAPAGLRGRLDAGSAGSPPAGIRR